MFLYACLIPCCFIHSANSHEEADSSGAVNHSEDESGNENRRRSAVSDSTGRGEEEEKEHDTSCFVFKKRKILLPYWFKRASLNLVASLFSSLTSLS